MIAAAIGLVLPIIAAWLALWSLGLRRAAGSTLVTAATAICLGIGLSSVVTFWWAVARLEIDSSFALIDATAWVVLAAVGWWGGRRTVTPPSAAGRAGSAVMDRVATLAAAAFTVIAAVTVATVVVSYLAAPHGHWDAWAIWNQKARFLVRDIDRWTDMQAISWSNPSHPFLVSLTVARLWAYSASESTLVPAAVSALWGAGIVMVVIGTLRPWRWQAWVAAALVVAPVVFSDLASAQTADLPVAFFIVTTLALVREAVRSRDAWIERNCLLMAGLIATIAAWTKNEGVLFTAIVTLIVAAAVVQRRRAPVMAWWLAGLLPVGFCLIWLKFVVAPLPPEYLMETASEGSLLDRLLVPARHALVIPEAFGLWLKWGGNRAYGLLPLAMAIAVTTPFRRPASGTWPLVATLLLMIGGYYVVWVGSALDTEWLVRTTFDRLMMQLWPAFVVVAFCGDD